MKKLGLILLAATVWVACSDGTQQHDQGRDDEPVAKKGLQLPVHLGVNLLTNPDFEYRQVTSGVWPINPGVSAWEMSGNRWYQYRPTANDTWPQPSLGTQYIWLGKDLDTAPSYAKQRLGTVKPGLLYNAKVRIRRMGTAAAGTLSLQAFDGDSTWHVLTESSNWSSLPVGAWHELSVNYDSGAAPPYRGYALYFVVKNTVSSTSVDNAEVTAILGTGGNLVANPGFEQNVLAPGYQTKPTIPSWTGTGTWYQYRSYSHSSSSTCYPPATADQFVELGVNGATNGSLTQTISGHTFSALGTYRVSADVWRRRTTDPGGTFRLTATAPGQADLILGSGSWATAGTCSTTGGAWTRVAFEVDGAGYNAANGRTLKLELSSAQGPLVDNVVVSVDPERLEADTPYPADGATDVHPGVTLSWRPGQRVATTGGHRIYLSTSADAVIDRLPTAERVVNDPSHYPGGLTPGQKYYWRVDELNPEIMPRSWPGRVWSFSVRAGPGAAGSTCSVASDCAGGLVCDSEKARCIAGECAQVLLRLTSRRRTQTHQFASNQAALIGLDRGSAPDTVRTQVIAERCQGIAARTKEFTAETAFVLGQNGAWALDGWQRSADATWDWNAAGCTRITATGYAENGDVTGTAVVVIRRGDYVLSGRVTVPPLFAPIITQARVRAFLDDLALDAEVNADGSFSFTHLPGGMVRSVRAELPSREGRPLVSGEVFPAQVLSSTQTSLNVQLQLVEQPALVDAFEPDDSIVTARARSPLVSGTSEQHSMPSASDEDYVPVSVSAGSTYRVALFQDASRRADFTVHVLNGAGTALASANATASDYASNPVVEFTAALSQSVFVRVTRQDSSKQQASYRLLVEGLGN